MVMNTAQAHFNEDMMSNTPLGTVISYGGVNFSIVLGLSSQDTVENALAEIGLDQIKLKHPVVPWRYNLCLLSRAGEAR